VPTIKKVFQHTVRIAKHFNFVGGVLVAGEWNFYIGGYQPAQKWLKVSYDKSKQFSIYFMQQTSLY